MRICKSQKVIIDDNVIIDNFTYIPCSLEVENYTHIGASCSMISGAETYRLVICRLEIDA